MNISKIDKLNVNSLPKHTVVEVIKIDNIGAIAILILVGR